MPLTFNLSDGLKKTIKVFAKKDKKTCETLENKIKQIVSSDETTIEHYKNLRYGMSDYKRVHISKSFVLIFKVDKTQNHIIFEKLDHHDNIYKK